MAKFKIKGRLSFEHIFEKQGYNGSEPKYSAVILVSKHDPQIAALRERMEEAAKAQWKDAAPQVLATLLRQDRVFMRDGDLTKYPDYHGMWAINASNRNKPTAYDQYRQPVEKDSGLIYSGCYVYAMIEPWAQDNQYGKRMNCKLLGVQFAGDGDRLSAGSGPASAEDFDDLGDIGEQTSTNPADYL